MLGHLKPKHPRLDDSLSILVLASSGERNRQPTKESQRKPAPAADGGGKDSALSCPFTQTKDEGTGSPAKMCGFVAASEDALEAHVHEDHADQVRNLVRLAIHPSRACQLSLKIPRERSPVFAPSPQIASLSEALAKVARYHAQSGTHVCPIRVFSTPVSKHGEPSSYDEGPHARNGNMCCSRKELMQHLQVKELYRFGLSRQWMDSPTNP